MDISIHALLAESDFVGLRGLKPFSHISIHALLAESDASVHTRLVSMSISIHALLAESDAGRGHVASRHQISIHALLAESDSELRFFLMYHYFYPRSPCGERLVGAP